MEAEGKSETVCLQPVADPDAPPPHKDGDDYDPHLHRNLPKPTNNLETLVHLLKCSLGTGILAMPQAFARAGLVTGVISTVLVGALITHCLHVLVRAQYDTCKRLRVPLLSYPESMAEALTAGPPAMRRCARPSTVVVDIFLVVYQLGICCVYIVFIADNIKKVVDTKYVMSTTVHMLIILGPLIGFNLIPSLKLLAPFSALANVLTFIGLGIVVYYLVTEEKSPEPLDLWGSPNTFPLFFGTILFALTAVGVVIALENNMKTPKAFVEPCGVLNVGMSIIVLMYVAIGALGYVFCVSHCSDSITLDLPPGPLASSVIIMFAVAIFISYALHCYVPVEVVWRGYLLPRLQRSGSRHLRLAEYALRIGLCLLTFVLAVAVPRLGLFIFVRSAVPVGAGHLLPGADGGVPVHCAQRPAGHGDQGRGAVRDRRGGAGGRHVHGAAQYRALIPARQRTRRLAAGGSTTTGGSRPPASVRIAAP